MTVDASWRGIATEQVDEVSAPLAALLRKRSRRLLADLLRPYRRGVTWTAVAIVVASLAALAGPWLVGLAIDNGIPPLVNSGDTGPLLQIAAVFAVTVLIQAVATRMFVTMTGRVGQSVVLELRRRLFWHMLRLPVAFHEGYTSGRVISRQTSDVEAISSLFEEGLDSLISAALTLVLVGTGMLLLDWQLALVVLAGFLPLAWLSAWYRRESATAYRRIRETNALVIVHFVETFGGLRAVQAFRRERRNAEIFDELSANYARASRRSSQLIAVFGPGISLVANVIIGLVLCYGGLLVIDGDIKVGVLATFLLYLGRFFDPLQDVSQFYNSFQGAASGLEKISGVLEEEPSVAEPTVPAMLPAAASGRRVEFDAVRFGYREAVVLPDFDLDIPAGQTVAIVGETGAGKTTVARLLARFYDPDEGRVLLDGIDVRDLPDDELRTEIVLITQESFLFEGTVAENIRLGRPQATDA
ncbi:MAG: ABC transporter transmembrane domain-containing protein, partial [Trebonia sp.]